MSQWVEVSFDCLPLRSVGRLDIPIDASPAYRDRCERILKAIETHGSHNSYFLYNALCKYHLTNDEKIGTIAFRFEGALLTNSEDTKADRCDLQCELAWETCDWLTEPMVKWFSESVSRSVLIEFNRYINAGDLEQTQQRIEEMQQKLEQSGGFLGMYL